MGRNDERKFVIFMSGIKTRKINVKSPTDYFFDYISIIIMPIHRQHNLPSCCIFIKNSIDKKLASLNAPRINHTEVFN